ncbi:multidrug ABC transporter ATP-binding protein [Paenibacillus darwinianus]|uniref:Multidrug ABC transporter ATP-binding protein n=1 Tax=Paenibacillus darwinianus TaxID=1380763 RepID=A0A9W5RZL7_9BACL|nr:ABC transporter ATP-binding protein [Paenibacillus darwinianus]EXX86493.1 multidrug ABC transporter ATP-binding protein [Paenibacillus darwinianus]EXX86508.1 multidrug ABC transporter ATP-binding protein [Paenibacillus darwinianus]EXX87590.1 ABC transporter ATP-binding protein [Paenibacillus darwinianus]
MPIDQSPAAAGASGQAADHAGIVLSVRGLKKRIRGKWIIRDVGFEVHAGEIFGFLGPNGSGKTTTIRMLVDLVKPTEGEVRICGFNVHKQPEQALRHVGCIVENPEVYPYLTGLENLRHFARMQPGVDESRIQEVVGIVGLERRIGDKVKTYSLGMRQRLGIAQALLGKPRLLILDEPTNGLDPKGIKELREFIRGLAEQGMSLFISSHLLSEIELMCDRVAILSSGQVLAVGSVDELVKQAGSYVVWQFDRPEAGSVVLESVPDIRIIPPGGHRIDETVLAGLPGAVVTVMGAEQIPGAVEELVRQGIGVQTVQRVAPTLEELFLTMTEGEGIA